MDRAADVFRWTDPELATPNRRDRDGCGFVSASHFSKAYRENFEMTPSRMPQNADGAGQPGDLFILLRRGALGR